MCGIAGVFSADPDALAPIGRMTRALRHRGPDDEGYVFAAARSGPVWRYRGPDTVLEISDPPLPLSPPDTAILALGHRRLSIIDLSAAGHGPMASPDGRLWITYNGEIYNYLELREELRGLGHAFATATDTEVLLAAYAQWGLDCLRHFNGMWAFALYDAQRRTLFCARDRFGVKPFYYFWNGETLAFASEIKGLLQHPIVPRQPNDGRVVGFLCRGTIDESEETFFAGIKCLPAGHTLELQLDDRRLLVRRYYELPAEPLAGGSDRPSSGAFRELLEDAVRLRLRSDVDVGTCLSGGLDSSSILALAAGLRDRSGAGGQRAFSALYADPGLSEERFVNEMLRVTGAIGERTTPTSNELARDLPALIRHQDEPVPSAGVYSQWRVMALAHGAGVKVLLDGQGADEVLGGYHYQLGPFLAEMLRRHGPLRAWREGRALRRVTGLSPAFLEALTAYHALPMPAAVRQLARERFASQSLVPVGALDPQILKRAGPLRGERHEPRRSLASERRANVSVTSLPALLRYEDRNSMAFGIEARTPFLDYRLVEAAFALPAERLVHNGWTKWILREAMSGVLPEAVRLRRDKLGFATPERRWLGEMVPIVRQSLQSESLSGGLLRAEVVRNWLAEPDSSLARNRGLWRLVSLEHWLRYAEAPLAPAS